MVTVSTGELAVVGMGVVGPGISGPADALAPAGAAAPGWFRAQVALPGRGYRRLPDACKYLLAASRLAVGDAGDRLTQTERDHRGAAVAINNTGAALLEAMDRTIMREGAAEMSPSSSPFIAMSSFASRLSMEHDITGFNLTVNSPVTAGLEALQIAARAVAAARARAVLVGAVEEALSPSQSRAPALGSSPQSSAVGSPLCSSALGSSLSSAPGTEVGAAVLHCEPAVGGCARYGTCRARGAFLAPGVAARDAPAVLGPLVGDDPPGRIDAVLDDSAVGTAAARWLDRLTGTCEVVIVPAPAQAGCLTPLQRVVGLFAQEHTAPTRRAVLAASAQGTLAYAELTVTPRGGSSLEPCAPRVAAEGGK
ncbi:beta-ketoacyl synthase N-terminal-like domain-containing protein [Streptomyces aureocirculatus]|uniref:beta-ketoacyl synthase N-terminal-like domain-containing protein n=1 Tax=Streptomyces aureocirculatus TaxID=67275 RepID=UPI000B2D382A|nr:beta-ketoacyl synthase N-terminal-like domain-containing protein [Streptomyces aureocirculatus]